MAYDTCNISQEKVSKFVHLQKGEKKQDTDLRQKADSAYHCQKPNLFAVVGSNKGTFHCVCQDTSPADERLQVSGMQASSGTWTRARRASPEPTMDLAAWRAM